MTEHVTAEPKRIPFYKRRSFHILVSATLLAILCSRLQSEDLTRIFTQAAPIYIILFFVIEFADRIFMAWKWRSSSRRHFHAMKMRSASI